jgi:hypothetical protein
VSRPDPARTARSGFADEYRAELPRFRIYPTLENSIGQRGGTALASTGSPFFAGSPIKCPPLGGFFVSEVKCPDGNSDGMLASDGSEAIPALIETNAAAAQQARQRGRGRAAVTARLFLAFDVEDEPELRSGDLRRQRGGVERTAWRPD